MLRRNLFLIDFDDSLLPTTWLQQQQHHAEKDGGGGGAVEQLQNLEKHVLAFLLSVLPFGRVLLVTNAAQGWVELACAMYFPSVAKLLPVIEVVSARALFEPLFPDSPGEWKIAAFRDILHCALPQHQDDSHRLHGEPKTSVVSVGDSFYEREAVHIAAGELDSVLVKSIQLMSRPTALELSSQLEILNQCMLQVLECDSHLDLMLQKTAAVVAVAVPAM